MLRINLSFPCQLKQAVPRKGSYGHDKGEPTFETRLAVIKQLEREYLCPRWDECRHGSEGTRPKFRNKMCTILLAACPSHSSGTRYGMRGWDKISKALA